jgi:hypothetical protein
MGGFHRIASFVEDNAGRRSFAAAFVLPSN